MKCPYFEETKVRYCKAFEKKIMIPSRVGKEKYCTCREYLNCPVYIEHDPSREEKKKLKKE